MLDTVPTAATRAPSPTTHTIFDCEVSTGPFEGDAVLEGTLPDWLRGRLVRTAPAIHELGTYRSQHWFDGLGMLYRLDLEPGRVRFAQRLLETKALAAARAGKMSLATFAGTIERSFLDRLFHPIPPMTDNANVHVVPTPEGWLAMTETPVQQLVDGDSLKIKREVRYHDSIGKLAPMLAHPEWDPRTREIVNIATRIGRNAEIVAYRHAPGATERTPIGRVALPEIPYLHAFGLTPKKVVIVAPPLLAKPVSMLWSNKGYIDHFRWHGDRPTRVFVIDRATGAVSEHEADPFFYFHAANAYDDGDSVVMDLCAYRDPSLVDKLRMDKIREGLKAESWLERLRISPSSKRVTMETASREHLEFPTVDRRRVLGQRHRYVYGASLESVASSQLRRVDVETGRVSSFARENVVYGEPLFVANPEGGEGDGVLLSVGCNLNRGKAELVVLDAASLEPLATARLPIAIPLGFHGSFRAADAAKPS